MRANVYSPATLAKRWECSERTIRNMISDGELPYFRVRGKLFRIRAVDVEEYECRTGESQNSAANTASPSMMEAGGDVIALEHAIQRRRPARPRLDSRN